jgi:hypothetical protein
LIAKNFHDAGFESTSSQRQELEQGLGEIPPNYRKWHKRETKTPILIPIVEPVPWVDFSDCDGNTDFDLN